MEHKSDDPEQLVGYAWLTGAEMAKHGVKVKKLTTGLYYVRQKGGSRGWIMCGLFLFLFFQGASQM